jgi:hypothetical protein
MKRVLSLVLVLTLVLGSIMPAFAEETTNSEAGQNLYDFGLIAGDGTDLAEDQPLTRAELAVILAKMYGEAEAAEAYELPFGFADITGDEWYAPWVNYAGVKGWMTGDGTNFNPKGEVNAKMVLTVMMEALGHTVDYATIVADAEAAGLTLAAADETMVMRGEIFATVRAALDLKS